jgi:hypothetical protein
MLNFGRGREVEMRLGGEHGQQLWKNRAWARVKSAAEMVMDAA